MPGPRPNPRVASDRPAGGGARGGACRGRELGILAQDRGFELAQLGTGIDAELVEQRLAAVPIGGQGLGLAPRAVERQHQQSAEALAGGMGGDQTLELRDEVGIAAERQLGLEALLDRYEPALAQSA